jgi:hypothetical protein
LSSGSERTIAGADCSTACAERSRVSAAPVVGVPYLDGSFVTTKEEPGDFDACWEAAGVDPELLNPVLLTFANRRAAQKARFGGELFPAEAGADPHCTRFLDYFQQDRVTGERKGIVALDLENTP